LRPYKNGDKILNDGELKKILQKVKAHLAQGPKQIRKCTCQKLLNKPFKRANAFLRVIMIKKTCPSFPRRRESLRNAITIGNAG
jgi:hypothetical protein